MRAWTLLALIGCSGGEDPPTPPPSCAGTGFADRDGDGFGDPALQTDGCVEPVVPDGTDCDDGNFFAYPGREEVCDGFDNDCDGLVDAEDPDGDIPFRWPDADGDGFGEGDGRRTCAEDPGDVEVGGDCDGEDPDVNPGADEVCGGGDDDCDGLVDDEDPTRLGSSATVWYADGDLDGHGGSTPVPACVQPAGTAPAADDCDDGDPLVAPSAAERCNGVDDDCDGGIDGPPFTPDACAAFEGTWTGPYQVAIDDGVTPATCVGTATVVIDRDQDPVLQGSFSCELAPPVGGFSTSQTGSVEAVVMRDGLLEGTAVAFEGVPRDWTGSLVGETLTGAGGGLYVSGGTAWELDFGWALAFQLLP